MIQCFKRAEKAPGNTRFLESMRHSTQEIQTENAARAKGCFPPRKAAQEAGKPISTNSPCSLPTQSKIQRRQQPLKQAEEYRLKANKNPNKATTARREGSASAGRKVLPER